MITIFVNAQLGITYDNMPEQVFSFVQGDLGQAEDGGPKFGVDGENIERVVDLIRRAGMANTRGNVEINRIGAMVLIKPAQENQEQNTEEQDQHRAPEALTDRVERREEPEPEGDIEEDREEDQDPEDEPSMTDPLPEDAVTRLNPEHTVEMIASTMQNELSSMARNRRDKRDRFEREWTRLISLKREIDAATAPIENNPIISDLLSQVEELRSSDNLIDEIFFMEGYLVVKTKELVTEEEIEGSKRLIGRMEIKVDLKPIVGNSSECPNPISIRNMDRRYFDGGETWECAHTPSGGGMCWGTAWEMLFNAMTSRDIPSIIEVVIRFIRNPNPADSWGRHIVNWPEAA